MRLVYDDGRASVWNGDARALTAIPDGSVHLIVTSPPYNAGVMYDGYADWLPWLEYWEGLIEPSLRECYRVLCHGGRLALNIANVVRSDVPQPGHRPRPTQYQSRNRRRQVAGKGGATWALMVTPLMWTLLETIGFLPREHLTWAKGEESSNVPTQSNAWGTYRSARNPVLRAVSEPVLIASKGSHSREADGVSDLTADEFKAWTRNVWSIPTYGGQANGQHPATFPVEIPRRLIKLYSYVGDTVLDPFAGSGTTLAAAKLNGRRAIGVELSEKYCRLAANRCRQDLLPLEISGAVA